MLKNEAFTIIQDSFYLFLDKIDQTFWECGEPSVYNLNGINRNCYIGQLGMCDSIRSIIS